MKNVEIYKGSGLVTAYQPADLQDSHAQLAIAQAEEMWRDRCKAYYAANGDVGSCVLGAGIEILYIPKGCRRPIRKMIISAYDVSCAQGSCVWEASVKEVMAFLDSKGFQCQYNPGNMD